MKRTITVFALMAMFAISCTKYSVDSIHPTAYGSFSYGGNSYTATLVSEGVGSGHASYNISGSSYDVTGGTSAPTMSVNFIAKPTVSGVYRIVAANSYTGTSECSVIYTASTGVRYLSSNFVSQLMTVTVTGNSVNVRGDGITLEEENNSANSGTTSFEFHN